MSEIKWIKLLIDTFDDEKIKLIQATMPEGDAIVLIWLRLLCQAGKCNAGGYVYLNNNRPYTPEMLAALFGKPVLTVNLALRTFQEFGMIEIDEHGFIWITNWEKHQNIDAMDRKREQARLRKQRERERNKGLIQPPDDKNDEMSRDVTQQSRDVTQQKEERRKKKEEVDKEKDIKTLSDSSDDAERIILFLNERADRMFRPTEANRKEIKARMKKGAKIEECMLVIDWKVSQWSHNPEMAKNLNPVTLFRASNFDRYLDEAREELMKRGEDFERVIAGYAGNNQPSSPFAGGKRHDTEPGYYDHLVQ